MNIKTRMRGKGTGKWKRKKRNREKIHSSIVCVNCKEIFLDIVSQTKK